MRKEIPLEKSFKAIYDDGSLAFMVLRKQMPNTLSDHLYYVGQKLRAAMGTCSTRNVSTIHFGAKEYTPNSVQRAKYGGHKRVWKLDRGQNKEDVVAILPELLYADKLLQKVCPDIYNEMVNANDEKFRMAQTCFTRAALNSSDATTHRDFGMLLLYNDKSHYYKVLA